MSLYRVLDSETGLFLTNYRDSQYNAWTWDGTLFKKEHHAKRSLETRGKRDSVDAHDGDPNPYRFRLIEYALVETKTRTPF